ncbi:transmembrane protein 19 isoform X1 [Culex quinquefasciatus]|uniref:Transmembrane protein 19 n=1 Tax=Culex pipiens TaxID=7175 RepID=A0A8D8N094_CULPI|nr:transmembrane protein 19 isoform X1 [Culex quinquefasciatus]XP_038110696.1 transmembrane protein 19 isoform X1 [Culex quinquefasciatus]XP_038110697.1 transmembrane protein 19 isoform X1 [Culex quinquefasciatus]
MSESTFYKFLPLLLCALSVPLSMFMWIGNVAYSKIASDEENVIPPARWLFSILVPLLLMLYGLKRKGVNKSGAIVGLLCATILSIASHAFLACLAMFFFSSSRATKFRAHLKRKYEEDFRGGEGRRNWAQVICNAGYATTLAMLYLLDCGYGERPVDFGRFYRCSWLGVGIMGAFACCNGDTWASELGAVLSRGDPFLITTWKRVPRGTNGGVSLPGLVVSFLGGIAVGLSYYLSIRYTLDAKILANSPNQWPIIVFGGVAGLLGSVVDSVMGATVQFSGVDEEGKIVERPGKNVRHICGVRILDNHSVNLISAIVTGLVMPSIAMHFWKFF